MADERNGPGDGHRIVPDRDEVAHYQRSRQARSSLAGRLGDVPKVPTSSTGGKVLTGLLLLLVLALGGAAGWLFTELQATQARLAEAVTRVESLERRLSVTDESVTESATSMQVKIKELDFEIRKLWDNVWKRSKERLATHDAQIEKLQASDKEIQSFVASAKKQLASNQQVITELTDKLEQYTRLEAAVEVNSRKLQQQQQALQAAVDKANKVASQLNALEKRVQENEEWVASINNFRKQVNQDLIAIKQRLGGL